ASREGGTDHLGHVLSARRHKEKDLRQRRRNLGGFEEPAHSDSERGAVGFAREDHIEAAGRQSRGQSAALGRLARALDSLDGDERAAHARNLAHRWTRTDLARRARSPMEYDVAGSRPGRRNSMATMRRHRPWQAGALVLAAMLLATAGPAAAAEPIRVGYLGPLTGIFAQAGKDMLDGFKMALDEAGYQAGPRKIE